jgi:ATP-dependent DNA ligase
MLALRAPTALSHRDLMLATSAKAPFSKPGWIYELKYDGFRCHVAKRGVEVRLGSRNGRNMADAFPEIVEELAPMRGDFDIDTELVILDDEGRPQWDRLHRRHATRSPQRARMAAAEDPAVLFAFDLMTLDGADFRPRPLLERKAALFRLLPANRRVRYAGHLLDDCSALWEMVTEKELEGIVAKQAASPYVAGRATTWRKIKSPVGAERERERFPE